MPLVLVDSSVWVDALRRKGDPTIKETVRELTVAGQVRTADQVLLELWNGARDEKDAQVLRELEQELDRLETTPQVWAEARRLAWRCRRAGVTVPSGDLLIAACARVHEVDLLHRDAHFDRIAAIAAKGKR